MSDLRQLQQIAIIANILPTMTNKTFTYNDSVDIQLLIILLFHINSNVLRTKTKKHTQSDSLIDLLGLIKAKKNNAKY